MRNNEVMTNVKISVLISTFNTGEYICECIESIVNQTLDEIEIIVIDDGSTDDTSDILSPFHSLPNFIYKYQDNTGAGIARNRAIDLARGKYIFFMDPDDKFPHLDCLEKLYVIAEREEACLCGGNIVGNDFGTYSIVYKAGDGDLLHRYNQFIESSNYIHMYGHTRYLYKLDFIKQNDIHFAPYRRFEDQIFTVNAIGKAQKIYELDYDVYEYRINYKSTQYDKKLYYDILCGFRDTIYALSDNKLRKMYDNNVELFIKNNLKIISEYFFDYIYGPEDIIIQIKSIIRDTGWSEDFNLLENDYLKNFKNKLNEFESVIETIISNDEQIYIYGAGKNTKYLLNRFPRLADHIRCIFVSNEPDIKEISGIPIKKFSNETIANLSSRIIITPKQSKEIENVLMQNGIENIYSVGDYI